MENSKETVKRINQITDSISVKIRNQEPLKQKEAMLGFNNETNKSFYAGSRDANICYKTNQVCKFNCTGLCKESF